MRPLWWAGLAVALLLVAGCGVTGPDSRRGALGHQAPVSEGVGVAARGQTQNWTFDADPEESAPPGTGVFGGRWVVRSVPRAPSPSNALCQVGNEERPGISLSDKVYGDLAATAHINLPSEELDRAGGLLFRVLDRDNYYLMRVVTRENNVGMVGLYEYVNGVGSLLREMPAQLSPGSWQELRVEAVGEEIKGFLNGKPVIQVADQGYSSGTLGLWTWAGSATCFDDVRAKAL